MNFVVKLVSRGSPSVLASVRGGHGVGVVTLPKNRAEMGSSVVAAGLGLAVIGFAGRYILRRVPSVAEAMKTLPNLEEALSTSKYYRGGFEPKMTRREASLILGISPAATKARIKEAHKRIITINHPDRKGSPYVASKINEAKDLLEKHAAAGPGQSSSPKRSSSGMGM